MRLVAFFVSILALSTSATASDSVAVWVFLDEAYLVSDDAHSTTRRALDRRSRRSTRNARKLAIDPAVVTELQQRGYRIRVISGLIGAVSVMSAAESVDALHRLPFVRAAKRVRAQHHRVEPVTELIRDAHAPSKTFDDAPDPGLSTEYLEMINALAPIRSGINGTGVLLGFLDTEFSNFTHEVFRSHRADGRIVGEANFTEGPQSNRHGLMVASTAAGRADGMMLGPAFGASLIGAVTEYAPTETRTEEENLVAGLEFLEAQGADVVNISLGYIDFDDDPGYEIGDLDGETAVTTIAVQRATELGVVVVVSAGNEACHSPEACWYYISTPADARGAITVGAVDEAGRRASFSSFGPTADGRIKPDVAAPGVRVPVAIGTTEYARANGTSFAAPLAAGVAAQMLQANPDLTPNDVKQVLKQTAHNSVSPDNALGWGIINAGAAVEEALRLRAEPPVEVVELLAPYPNPTTGGTTIEVKSPLSGFTGEISLYDATGREVMQVYRGTLSPGSHSFNVQMPTAAPGVYFFLIRGGGTSRSGSVVLLR